MNAQNTLSDRVKHLVSAKSTSPSSFAKKIGIEQTTFCSQHRGKTNITLATINAIAVAFPTLSMEWLIRGNGSMWHNRDMSSNTNTQIGGSNNTINTGTQLSSPSSDPRDEKIAMLQQQIDFMMNIMKMNANK